MIWGCPLLASYWTEVVDLLNAVTDRDLGLALGPCVLHWFSHTAKTKITSKFLDMGLLLAKREITMHWKARGAPGVARWKKEFVKWVECDGIVRLQLAKRSGSERALEAARAWEQLVGLLKDPDSDSEVDSEPPIQESEQHHDETQQ